MLDSGGNSGEAFPLPYGLYDKAKHRGGPDCRDLEENQPASTRGRNSLLTALFEYRIPP